MVNQPVRAQPVQPTPAIQSMFPVMPLPAPFPVRQSPPSPPTMPGQGRAPKGVPAIGQPRVQAAAKQAEAQAMQRDTTRFQLASMEDAINSGQTPPPIPGGIQVADALMLRAEYWASMGFTNIDPAALQNDLDSYMEYLGLQRDEARGVYYQDFTPLGTATEGSFVDWKAFDVATLSQLGFYNTPYGYYTSTGAQQGSETPVPVVSPTGFGVNTNVRTRGIP